MSQPQPPPSWSQFLATRLVPISPPGNSADDQQDCLICTNPLHGPPTTNIRRSKSTSRSPDPSSSTISSLPARPPHLDTPVRTAACAHAFHHTCLSLWLCTPRVRTCPLCRAPLYTPDAVLILHTAGIAVGRIVRKVAPGGEDEAVVKAVEGAVGKEVERIAERRAQVRKLAEKVVGVVVRAVVGVRNEARGWEVRQGWGKIVVERLLEVLGERAELA